MATVDETNEELRLLTRHLSGVATPEEERLLQEWLEADPSRTRLLELLRQGWDASASLPPRQHDVEQGWARLSARMQTSAGERAAEFPPRRPAVARRFPAPAPRRFDWGRAGRRAAAAVLLVATPAVLWKSLRPTPADDSAVLEVAVPRGQMATLYLPDGSRVVLAAESRLRYPHDFGEVARELRLEGMAYFEVAREPDRPFLVHAAGSSTQVLGTKFVVRAYPDAPRVEVVVTEGKVGLRAEGAPPGSAVPLLPGDVGRLSAGVARVVPAGDVRAHLAWMEGRPTIQDLPLTEAFAELERWYDVHLEIGDARLATRRITTTAERSSLRETLDMIALALDAYYDARGDTLVILPSR